MNTPRQNWLLSRRHLLRGLGISMALPFLDCMRPLFAAKSDNALKPRRSVFIYLPNGVNTTAWQIGEQGAGYKLSKPLESLEKHRSVITPFSGLYHPNGLGHHHNCQSIWLTGGKIGQAERNTISVDQLMAQITAPLTRYASLELSNQGGSMAWNPDGIQLPAHSSPGVAFREMFEDPKGGIAKQRRGYERRGSILDAILDDAKSLSSQLGNDDKGRLEQYLTAVREVEIRTGRSDKWLDTPRPNVESSTQAKLNRDISLQMLGEYLRTMYDPIVLAFQTDMTRVATFVTGLEGQGPAIPEIGIKQDRHSLSHHNGNSELLRYLMESDAFNITQFSYFLDRLKEVQDVDGPLLDTTMALYGSGMAYGHSHGNASLPILLAGGGKLGLKHGKHLDYNIVPSFKGYDKHTAIHFKPVNDKAHLSNVLLTMAQKMGVNAEKFADSLGTVSEVTA